MGNVALVSEAYVTPDPSLRPIVIAELFNPETIIGVPLKYFLQKVGFSNIYPNFGNVRVTNIHPFAMFLFQDIMQQPIDLSLLPSICISDSSDSETQIILAHDKEEINISNEIWATLKASIKNKQLITEQSNIDRIDAALLDGKTLVGIQKSFYADHNIDLNIWTDNKDVTSILYDLTKLFLLNETEQLKENGVEGLGSLGGRRSGDINTEFGKLLHGANVSYPCRIKASVMEISIIDNPDISDVFVEYKGDGQ